MPADDSLNGNFWATYPFRQQDKQGGRQMRFFPKKAILTAGLLAVVTMVGVYSATAGGSALGQRPSLPADQVAAKVDNRNDRVIRIVGPQFFPDNGDIKLLGAANERARRG